MADFEVNKRLKKLIKEVYNTTPFAFSKKYNDNRGVKTSQVVNEKNGLSNKLLDLILEAYPEINKTWLLTGEGEMFKSSNSSINQIQLIGNNVYENQVMSGHNKYEKNAPQGKEAQNLLQEIQYLKALNEEKDRLIIEKDRLIEEKERIIKLLLEKISS